MATKAPGMMKLDELKINFMGYSDQKLYPLVMTNSSPLFVDGPNRNRWFTVLNSMVDLSSSLC